MSSKHFMKKNPGPALPQTASKKRERATAKRSKSIPKMKPRATASPAHKASVFSTCILPILRLKNRRQPKRNPIYKIEIRYDQIYPKDFLIVKTCYAQFLNIV